MIVDKEGKPKAIFCREDLPAPFEVELEISQREHLWEGGRHKEEEADRQGRPSPGQH